MCNANYNRMKDSVLNSATLYNESTETVLLQLPKADMSLLKALIKRMGWHIQKPTAYEQSLDDTRKGDVYEYDSVDSFFRDVLGK